MAKYKVTYDREGCISAAACAGISPKFWKMDEGDGKANMKGAEKNSDGIWEMEIGEEDLKEMKESAEVCPVLIIHIINKETGEKIF